MSSLDNKNLKKLQSISTFHISIQVTSNVLVIP